MSREIIVVDCETTGLDPARHSVVEVAWWNLMTDETGCFVPPHDVGNVLSKANVGALRVNRYIDRLASAPQDTNRVEAKKLWAALQGNTLAGSNPSFDAAFIMTSEPTPILRGDAVAPWHHRLLDLAAFAAGHFGLSGAELPGLAVVCERLGVAPPDHTASGDVQATGECFKALGAVTGSVAA